MVLAASVDDDGRLEDLRGLSYNLKWVDGGRVRITKHHSPQRDGDDIKKKLQLVSAEQCLWPL